MSDPVQTSQLHLIALSNALNDDDADSQQPRHQSDAQQTHVKPAGTATSAPVQDGQPVHSLAAHSETLAQPPTHSARLAVGAPELPATLSPSSARSVSPDPAPPASTTTTTMTTASSDPGVPVALPARLQTPWTQEPPLQQARTQAEQAPSAVQELTIMFPDFDVETIAAILVSTGGNQEEAVNALLQMSDPTYRPPAAGANQTDSDALLAQTLAAEEQHRHQLRQQQQASTGGRGGGGTGAFFSEIGSLIGGGAAAGSQKPTTPTYDASNLTYQPRVRRQPAPASARAAYAAPSTGASHGQSVVPDMPGPNEAKQWQEEINRMAETGFAKAASTFSSLKQRAEAALASSGTPSPGQAASFDGTDAQRGQAGGNNSGGGGFWRGGGRGASSYLDNFGGALSSSTNSAANNGRHGGSGNDGSYDDTLRGLASPKSPQMGGYDRDPSPVGDNELANILARGRGNAFPLSNSAASSAGGRADNGKSCALADRYGRGISSSDGGGGSRTTARNDVAGGGSGSAGYSIWEEAARTPITISDNSGGSGKAKDSVALMDSAQGCGVTSPSRSSLQQGGRSTGAGAAEMGAAAGMGVGLAAGVGAAAGAGTASSSVGDDGSDSDDLEYVSNPFEDED